MKEFVNILQSPKDVLLKIPPKKINIIISVYDGAEFIEECLDSIQAQTYRNYKILLGVDGCQKTLEKILEIKYKYDNLFLYVSDKNNGCYPMFNALINLVPDKEYIQVFGADDVMYPKFLETMNNYNVPAVNRHHGVLFIKKEMFKNVGGFRNWKCAADTDMVYRIQLFYRKKIEYVPLMFHRREHPKQLTTQYSTNHKSELRKKYNTITERNYHSNKPKIYIKPVMSKIYEYSN